MIKPTYNNVPNRTLQRVDPATGQSEVIMYLGYPNTKPSGWQELSDKKEAESRKH